MGLFKEKSLEVQGKELEAAQYKHTSLHFSQPFQKNGDSDNEEPEMDSEEDPEEEPEEDPEEEPEEDPEEEPGEDLDMDEKLRNEKEAVEFANPFKLINEIVSAEQPTEHEDEDPLVKCAFEPKPESGADKVHQNLSDGKPRILVSTAVRPSLSQYYGLEKNCKYDEASKQEFNIKYAAIDQHCVLDAVKNSGKQASPGKRRCGKWGSEEEPEDDPEEEPDDDPEEEPEEELLEVCEIKPEDNQKEDLNVEEDATEHEDEESSAECVFEPNQKQAHSGKRRRSRWDQDPGDGKKTIIEDGKLEKGKRMWDADDSMSRLQEPLQLAELRKQLCGPLLDFEVASLKIRFSNISSILNSLVDEERVIGVYAPEKLIKERDWIFFELAKRNAIICKELYIPVKEYPTYNFIGLILGPKGNTQKRMEFKSGAKIRVRGKTSSKLAHEGDPSADEDFYVYIEAVNQKSLDAAVCMVEKLLIPVEDEMNSHKQAQLQELYNLKAANFISSCSVCKEPGHNHLSCPQKKTTLKAACDRCGSFTHPTSGCLVTPSTLKIKSSREIDPANLFIGFLPQTVDDIRLWELFSPFGTITQSKVTLDMTTGYSKGYGFVKFDTPSAASLAIMHMNGFEIYGHRLTVRIARAAPAIGQPATSLLPVYPDHRPATVATSCPDLPNCMMPEAQVSIFNGEGLTNLYVGYLPKTIDDKLLRELFSPFGTVTQSRVILDFRTGYSKGHGFVSFDTPSAASLAIMHMNGYQIDGHRLVVGMRTAGTAPPTGPPNLLPVYSIPQPAPVATSCPAFPYYMMPISQNMENKNQTEAPIIPQEVSGSTGLSNALSSTAIVSRSTESGTASSTNGLISGSTGPRTALLSTGLVTSNELRSVISSYSFSSLFCSGPSYPSS